MSALCECTHFIPFETDQCPDSPELGHPVGRLDSERPVKQSESRFDVAAPLKNLRGPQNEPRPSPASYDTHASHAAEQDHIGWVDLDRTTVVIFGVSHLAHLLIEPAETVPRIVVTHVGANRHLVVPNSTLKFLHLEGFMRRERIRVGESWIEQTRAFETADCVVGHAAECKTVASSNPSRGQIARDGEKVLRKTR